MNTMHPLSLKQVVVAVVAAVALMANTVPVFAKDSTSQTSRATQKTIQSATVWADPVMQQAAAYSGRALLEHLESVKGFLATGNIAQARGALENSREFAAAIALMMPYMVVVDQIRNAKTHVTQESTEEFSADLLPIYANLDEMSLYASKLAAKVRAGVKRAEQHAKAGNTKAAAKDLQGAANDISVTTVYMPVRLVAEQVNVAQKALDKYKPDVATASTAMDIALASLSTVVRQYVYTPLQVRN